MCAKTLIYGEIVETLGYYSAGDGGGAKYKINNKYRRMY